MLFLLALHADAQQSFNQYNKKFVHGSGIIISHNSQRVLSNLDIIGKIWGILKYYHPNVRAGKYNWDFELFNLIGKIYDAPPQIRDLKLCRWIKRFGSIDSNAFKKKSREIAKMEPNFSWIESSPIQPKLRKILKWFTNISNDSTSFYVQMGEIPISKFNNENPYSEFSFPDDGYRLLALFRYWNVIKYYYPYRYNFEKKWDSILPFEIGRFLKVKNELTYKLAILELITQIQDSHARIVEGDQSIEDLLGKNRVPVEVGFIENKPVVIGYYDSILGPASGLRKGDVILGINGREVHKIIESNWPFTPASNNAVKFRQLAFNFLRTNDTLVKLRIRRADTTMEFNVKTIPSYLLDIYYRAHIKDTCFKIYNNIAYINPWFIRTAYIPEILQQAAHTKGLVIDLRNPIKENMQPILDYFLDKEKPFAKITRPSNTCPGEFTFFKTMTVGKNAKVRYECPIILLVNENTQSSAEFNVMAFRTYKKTIVIGSTTAGADGNVTTVCLPGGVLTSFTSLGVYYNDYSETQLIGIIPDISITPSISGIIKGHDEILQKAIEVLEKAN